LYHTLPSFAPISRFAPGEVEQLILDIETTLHNIPPSRPFTVTPSIAVAMQRADSNREIISIPRNELTNDLFVHLWARDDPYPLVVTPTPGHKLLQYPWTPEFFTNITGRTGCNAQDCETGDIVPTTVGDFYSLFGKEYDDRQVLRLKVLCHFTISPFAFGLTIRCPRTIPPRNSSRLPLHIPIFILI
jgi:lysine-specific demethylase 3